MQREADGANTRWNPWERRITPANVASLQPVWSRHLVSRRPSQPLIAGGHVYVSRSSTSQPEAGIVALDLATGQTNLGPHDLAARRVAGVPDGPGRGRRRRAVDGVDRQQRRPVLGDRAHRPRRQRRRQADSWPATAGAAPALQRPPCGGGQLDGVLAFRPQVLTVTDASTGATRWSAQASNFSPTQVAVGDGLIVTGNGAYALEGCGLATCAPVWTASGGVGEPMVGGDVVYVEGREGAIEAYDADGCGLATCPPLASLSVPSATHMAVGEGHLLVTSPTTTAGTYQITALAPTSP